jgi:hypothetical protein
VHTRIYLYLVFSMCFLQRDVRDINYIDDISPNLSHQIIEIFHNITELDPSFSY